MRRKSHEWVDLLERRDPDVEHLVMGATSWQHIRTFDGDVERTLEQLRHDVFVACAFHVAGEPAVTSAPPGSPAVACLDRPASIEEALRWNGCEGTDSVLDITDGVAERPAFGAMSPLTPDGADRCFGNARPALFEVLMADFDAADVCEPGTGRSFIIAEPGEPALVVFVGCTGS